MSRKIKHITPFEENPSKWYLDIIHNGDLIDYGPFKGSVIFKPLAFSIWEEISKNLDLEFKKVGVKNVYMPLLIPESYIQKEEKHILGFQPELIAVERVGDKKLSQKFYIRPTSETLFAHFFKNQLRSYQNLPLLLNQWVNVLRWEKTTTPFLRTSEFLWQEGHTCHESQEEAIEFAKKMALIYKKFIEEFLAIPTYLGQKTPKERFAGADITFTLEAMSREGKALQAATSHFLGQNFSKAFEITCKDRNNQNLYPFQTSWGASTRLIGALIMNHGDDRGIIIPPKIAQNKVDILIVNPKNEEHLLRRGQQILSMLKSSEIGASLDNSAKNLGFKAANSEISGTPIRIEFGQKEFESQEVVIVRRDTLEKERVALVEIIEFVQKLLVKIQNDLFQRAKRRLEENTIFVEDYNQFKQQIELRKFVYCYFEGTQEDEIQIQQESGATTRLVIEENANEKSKCFWSGKESRRIVIFAKSY